MILGLGIDMVEVKRLEKWMDDPGLTERYFHPEELADALKKGASAALSLAARFAAKEAFGKALGKGLRGLVLKDIQVENDMYGKPEINLRGTAKTKFEELGGKKLFLSLSHEKNNAVAVVVIEG